MKLLSTISSYASAVMLVFVSGLLHISLAQEGSSSFQGSDNLAQAVGGVGKGFEAFGVLVNLSTTIAVSAAFLYFFINLYKFIKAGGDDKEEAKGKMIWSTVAIIIIVSLWGIIGFVRSTLGIKSGADQVNNVVVPGTEFNRARNVSQ